MPPPLPSLAQLLLSGGDARIFCDPQTGLNKYGCAPMPDPKVLAYGSSTASDISTLGFAAAETLYHRLSEKNGIEAPAVIYADEMAQLRKSFIDICGLADIDDVDTIFAPSGTDLHMLAAQLAATAANSPLLVITVETAETGSGVHAALEGQYFSNSTAFCSRVIPGNAILSDNKIDVATVPSRGEDGQPRPMDIIDSEIEAMVTKAVAAGQHTVLNLVDVSKTGLIAPSLTCAVSLHQRFPENMDIFVDACQFRVAPSTLRAYLGHNFWVALTGSKFMTGPAFSGVMLLPKIAGARLRVCRLPQALAASSAKADWPVGWAAPAHWNPAANYGLLLRWEAALAEMRAFFALSESAVTDFFTLFAQTVSQYLDDSPILECLPVPMLDRRPCTIERTWDSVQTIFPFLQYAPGKKGLGLPLSSDMTAKIYYLIGKNIIPDSGSIQKIPAGLNVRCQIGQPVHSSLRRNFPLGALRLCMSARLAVAALSPQGCGAQKVITEAMTILDKTAWLAGRFE